MPKLGQHFLTNMSVLKKIVDALDLRAGDVVIEVGPGHGELTQELAKKRANLTALERDKKLILHLGNRFKNDPSVKILEGDALDLLPKMARAAKTPWKLVGNIPYYITGHLLRTIDELKNKPSRSVLMVQREVADRMCAEPPDMNRLAATVQFWADIKIIAHVPRSDFSPPPEVDSAVVLLELKDERPALHAEQYYRAARMLFAQPRKTVVNNLFDGMDGAVTKEIILEKLEKMNLLPNIRPQNLAIHDIANIAAEFLG
ncbi:MAG TPA: 16S rRNA (adenine(1518)-N(6)/adenine(1519)-N(6))-dimethyltransferase RsmA [Candidatus Paceibacterota bacterium]|nr:16S rRNA (adenine(1518)-N(6)/adenine(1519)-N(6))-dimethyltransferase RsmA [Candidatus Paceibacterota bacterium]